MKKLGPGQYANVLVESTIDFRTLPTLTDIERPVIELLLQGQIALFATLLFAIVFSLTFHEFGHAASAKLLGDDTAEQAGRLTLNPIAHIDPLGLLMVVMVGFGYAKPVPVNPRRPMSVRVGRALSTFALSPP